jgi:hypothetical protein
MNSLSSGLNILKRGFCVKKKSYVVLAERIKDTVIHLITGKEMLTQEVKV